MPTLEVTNLRKSYGAVVVADDVDLSIDVGECVGIIGPNGAGKSSVFGLIAGSVAADGGRIVLDGRDITRLPGYRRARLGIGRAFQTPQPFADLTVYENVLSAAASGGGLRGAEMAESARARAGARRAHGKGGSARRRADRCSTASRWSWRGRWPPAPKC